MRIFLTLAGSHLRGFVIDIGCVIVGNLFKKTEDGSSLTDDLKCELLPDPLAKPSHVTLTYTPSSIFFCTGGHTLQSPSLPTSPTRLINSLNSSPSA